MPNRSGHTFIDLWALHKWLREGSISEGGPLWAAAQPVDSDFDLRPVGEIEDVLHRLEAGPWFVDHGASTNPRADAISLIEYALDRTPYNGKDRLFAERYLRERRKVVDAPFVHVSAAEVASIMADGLGEVGETHLPDLRSPVEPRRQRQSRRKRGGAVPAREQGERVQPGAGGVDAARGAGVPAPLRPRKEIRDFARRARKGD